MQISKKQQEINKLAGSLEGKVRVVLNNRLSVYVFPDEVKNVKAKWKVYNKEHKKWKV